MKTPRLFSVLKESVGRFFGRSVVVSLGTSTYGKRPEPKFKDILDYYRRDWDVKAAIDDLVERSIGQGFFTTCAEGQEAAKQVIDDFNERVNLDVLNQWIARDLWLTGNSFVEKVWSNYEKIVVTIDKTPMVFMTRKKGATLEDLKVISLDTFKRMKCTLQGQIQFIEQGDGSNTINLLPEDFIHYYWNRIDSDPLGVGLISPLILKGHGFTDETGGTSETKYRPSLLETAERMEYDMGKILSRFGEPNEIVVFEGLDASELAAKAAEMKALKAGERLATNRPAHFVTSAIDFRAKFDRIIDYIENAKIKALETPTIKLFTVPGFTEASANAAVKVSELKIKLFQRHLKRLHEGAVFNQVLTQTGFDPITAAVRLNWGIPESPEPIGIADLIQLARMEGETGYVVLGAKAIKQYIQKQWGVEVELPEKKDVGLPKEGQEPSARKVPKRRYVIEETE